MLRRLRELAQGRQSFAFETTLASKSYARWIDELQAFGYEFYLFFLWLDNADVAVGRVRERVRLGGHDIPEETIRRRYAKGQHNFFRLYQPLAMRGTFMTVLPLVRSSKSQRAGAVLLR